MLQNLGGRQQISLSKTWRSPLQRVAKRLCSFRQPTRQPPILLTQRRRTRTSSLNQVSTILAFVELVPTASRGDFRSGLIHLISSRWSLKVVLLRISRRLPTEQITKSRRFRTAANGRRASCETSYTAASQGVSFSYFCAAIESLGRRWANTRWEWPCESRPSLILQIQNALNQHRTFRRDHPIPSRAYDAKWQSRTRGALIIIKYYLSIRTNNKPCYGTSYTILKILFKKYNLCRDILFEISPLVKGKNGRKFVAIVMIGLFLKSMSAFLHL